MRADSMWLHVMVLALGMTAAFHVQATSQIPDQVVINGRLYNLLHRPIYAAFSADPSAGLKDVHRYVKEGRCSASAEGFFSRWEISDRKLWLVGGVANPCSGRDPIPLSAYFPGRSGRVEASWFTGKINVVGVSGDAKVEEEAVELTLERGRVVKERPIDAWEARIQWGVP